MKLNHFALVNGSKIDSFGSRKRERDSTRIDAAIKTALTSWTIIRRAERHF